MAANVGHAEVTHVEKPDSAIDWVPRLSHGVARRSPLAARPDQRHVAPDHRFRDFLGRRVRGAQPADRASLAHDGDRVGDRHHFVELVRDQDDGLPALAHLTENLPQLLDLRR